MVENSLPGEPPCPTQSTGFKSTWHSGRPGPSSCHNSPWARTQTLRPPCKKLDVSSVLPAENSHRGRKGVQPAESSSFLERAVYQGIQAMRLSACWRPAPAGQAGTVEESVGRRAVFRHRGQPDVHSPITGENQKASTWKQYSSLERVFEKSLLAPGPPMAPSPVFVKMCTDASCLSQRCTSPWS